MATKRQIFYTLHVFSLIVLLSNIINVNAVTDEEFSKLQSQMDTFAQRIVALEHKDFEKQHIIDKQQTTIKKQGDTIAEIQRDIAQQSLTVTELQTIEEQQTHTRTELQTTVKQQTRYIRQQTILLRSMQTELQSMKKAKRPQDMSTKLSNSDESIETEQSSPTPLSNNRIQYRSSAFQKDQANRKRFVNNEVEPVAFMARLSNMLSHVGVNQNIPFDNVLLNLGNAYHSQHGIFIAPQSGIYLFSSSILSNSLEHVEVHAAIVQNGNNVGVIYAHGDSGRHDQGAQTVVIQVKQGDEIWVRNIDNADDQIYGSFYSTFSGYLLLPL